MYACTVHSAVKMSLAVPQVLNVILKPNTQSYLKLIRKRIKLLKRQFFVTKTEQHLKKVVHTTNSTESSYKVAEGIANCEKFFVPLYDAIFYQHANIYFDINFYKLAHWK